MGERRKGKKTRLGEKLVHRSRIGMSRTRTTRFRVFVGSLPPPFPCPKKLDFAVGGEEEGRYSISWVGARSWPAGKCPIDGIEERETVFRIAPFFPRFCLQRKKEKGGFRLEERERQGVCAIIGGLLYMAFFKLFLLAEDLNGVICR